MSPRKKEKHQKRKRLGPWYQAGRIVVIIGAALIIIAAILDIIDYPTGGPVWDSYTFGQIHPIVATVIAVVVGIVLLWMMIDNRFAYSINLILFAIILFIIALLAGNIGVLVVLIGSILIVFEELAKG
ncbi:MAG: hypothetical protein GF308_13050 [Candidatus Heimdallarchaeota archaeon]|nr:hypothetical protein [Candidatus Heimdallarchaeota archaeon]